MYASLVELGIIPMNSTGIYLNGFTPNSTRHEILVKMGVNSLRLHLYACLIELGIIPVISTQFQGGSNSIPPLSNSTRHEILVKMGVNSLRLHLYACLIELGIIPVISTQFEGGSNSIPPGRIGCKSIEIMTTKFDQVAILCPGRHTNVISVNLHPI